MAHLRKKRFFFCVGALVLTYILLTAISASWNGLELQETLLEEYTLQYAISSCCNPLRAVELRFTQYSAPNKTKEIARKTRDTSRNSRFEIIEYITFFKSYSKGIITCRQKRVDYSSMIILSEIKRIGKLSFEICIDGMTDYHTFPS